MRIVRFLSGVCILLLALALPAALPGAHASTVTGSAVTISGLDDLNATVDTQARKGAGKVVAMLLGFGGLATVVAGRIGLGLTGMGSGLAMGFVPGIVSSGFDSAPAATVVAPLRLLSDAWYTPALAGAYPLLLALRVLQDPVFLACAALVLLSYRLRQARTA